VAGLFTTFPSLIGAEDYTIDADAMNMYPVCNLGPFISSTGNLYMAVIYQPTPAVTIMKSTDGGLTWNEMDAANRKTVTRITVGTHVLLATCIQDGDDLYVVHSRTVTIDHFDFTTDTWQATVASGGPAIVNPGFNVVSNFGRMFAVRRSNGNFVVLYGGAAVAFYTEWNGAAWSAGVTVGADLPIGFIGPTGAVVDSTDTVHFSFGYTLDIAVQTMAVYHQSLSPLNVLSASTSIDPGFFIDRNRFSNGFGCLFDDEPLVFIYQRFQAGVTADAGWVLALGTNLPTPTWAIEPIPFMNIDAASGVAYNYYTDAGGSSNPAARVRVIAVQDSLYVFAARVRGTAAGLNNFNFYTAFSTISSTWDGPHDIYAASFEMDDIYAGLFINRLEIGVVAQYDNGNDILTIYIPLPLAEAPPPPVPTPAPPRPVSTGGGVFCKNLSRLYHFNEFDDFMLLLTQQWEAVTHSFCEAKPACLHPWLIMPCEGRMFQPVKNIQLPVVLDVDTPVLTLKVPYGYDGVLTHVFNVFTGTPFDEGTGDLIWRVQVGNRFARDLGEIVTTRGSLNNGFQIPGSGIILRSDQLVTYLVNVTSALVGPPGARVICGMAGWFWPKDTELTYNTPRVERKQREMMRSRR